MWLKLFHTNPTLPLRGFEPLTYTWLRVSVCLSSIVFFSCTSPPQKPTAMEMALALPKNPTPLFQSENQPQGTPPSEDYVKRAQVLYDEGNFEKALITAKLGIQYNAYLPNLYLIKAKCYHRLNKPKETLLELNKLRAVEAHLKLPPYSQNYLRSEALLDLYELDSSITYSQQCIQVDSLKGPCRVILGKALRKKKQFKESIDVFRLAFQLKPQSSTLPYWLAENFYSIQQLDSSFRYIQISIENEPTALKPREFHLKLLFEKGKYNEVVEEAETIFSIDSNSVVAQEFRVLSLEKLQTFSKLKAHSITQLKTDSLHEPFLHPKKKLGDEYLGKGNLKEEPLLNQQDACTQLAISKNAQKDFLGAENQWRICKEKGFFQPNDYLPRAHNLVEMSRYQDALGYVEMYLQKFPKEPRGYVHRSQIYHFMGKHTQALQDCSRAISIDPKNAMAFYMKAKILFNTNLASESLDEINEAIRFEKNNPKYLDFKKQILFKLKSAQ